MKVGKKQLSFLTLLILACSISGYVYARLTISNTLTASSVATMPHFVLQWVTPPPAAAIVGETWIATIKVTNSKNVSLSGFRFVFNVTAPKPSTSAVTLSFLLLDQGYWSTLYGSVVGGTLQYTTGSNTIPPGESTFMIKGRYNFAGNYDWIVAIIGEEPGVGF